MQTNSMLAEELKKGNTLALKYFFESFYPCVCVYAIKFIHQDDVSEDIVQEAFIQYWKSREKFDDIRKAESFIYTSTRNACINYLKKKRYRDSICLEEFTITDSYNLTIEEDEEETCRVLHNAIESLPTRMQEIIVLCLKGQRNSEVAKQMEISINTVKTLKKNAYKDLRSKLQAQIMSLSL
jgi:RNA polymerase sigma-70 factor (ECF subfamily)